MKWRPLTYQLHLWAGLTSGLIVLIVSLTGCILVFEDQLKDALEPYRHVTAQNQPLLGPARLYQAGAAALPTGKKITGLVYDGPERAVVVSSRDRAKGENLAVYLNPYTGQVLKVSDLSKDPFITVMRLHRWLLLPNDIGRPIVGVATLIFVFLLLSGLVLWWPRSRRTAKLGFGIRWKAGGRKRLYDLHNVLGFYALGISLVLAVTGLTWSFEWVSNGLPWLANGGRSLPKWEAPAITPVPRSQNAQALEAAWQDTLPLAQAQGISRLTIAPPGKPGTPLQISLYPGPANAQRLTRYYDGNGTLVAERKPSDYNAGEKVRSVYYDLHVGGIAGLPTQILAFGASLISASLPVTGFWLWLMRLRSSRRGRTDTVRPEPAKQFAEKAAT